MFEKFAVMLLEIVAGMVAAVVLAATAAFAWLCWPWRPATLQRLEAEKQRHARKLAEFEAVANRPRTFDLESCERGRHCQNRAWAWLNAEDVDFFVSDAWHPDTGCHEFVTMADEADTVMFKLRWL
ncbi:hypothetical protein PX699_00280 [Sphingobium sp. H39-3-25]|uniref:hypothetical protein n=1 Tax=Sphingobium arseniciresistens TaxID=3030834 RepID=UPI0023BA2C9A|nr:hypothetical protein [Sphingobium arseniciresistens]